MNNKNNSSKSQIIGIVRRSLGCIDKRLVDHGERVAYIADKIAGDNLDVGMDREKLLVLCLLHDIGAYKTEEIDDMVNFETGSVLSHSAYGYVFLHNTTYLGDCVDAILYHHTNYADLQNIDTQYKTAAELIFLSDRIDILLASPGTADWSRLTRNAGTVFSPELIERFLEAEKRDNISAHIYDMTYADEVLPRIEAFNMTDDEILSFLKLLVYSIDFRSPFTVTHTANTAAISSSLARLFGIEGEQLETVFRGAFLHDIGKIAIPYSILENPGKLTDEEMDVMRTHVALSEQILRGIVPDEVCEIAIRHHEKLNGKGYHRGLSEADLTLPQRIVAVADVFSALINRRSYKEPFPKDKTIGILVSMRDSGDLCPVVVNTLLENYNLIMNETTHANDPVIRLYEKISSQYRALCAFS